MKLISISGLDGSGKSTQTEVLKKHLESQGKKVLYFHAIQFSFAQKLKEFKENVIPDLIRNLDSRFRGNDKKRSRQEKNAAPSTEPGSSAGVTRANWPQIQLRKIFLLIDVLRFRCAATRKYPNSYDYLLSDRYFFDSALNIQYLSKNNKSLLVEKIIPQPDKAFYLEVEPAMIMQRKRVPDQGIEYLRTKRDLFETSIAKWDLERIDGNRTEEEIFEEISNQITKMQDTKTKQ